MKTYHAIFLGGNPNSLGGRNIAGFRLRTSLEDHGYDMLVLDTAPYMTAQEVMLILDSVVTKDTLVFGFSTVWLNSFMKPVDWISDQFFTEIKRKFPHVTIVAGGTGDLTVPGSKMIVNYSDWVFNGFSDDSFYRLLNLLTGKPDGLVSRPYQGKRIVDSNKTHKVEDPNTILTRFRPEDGFKSYQPLPLEVSRGCIFRCSFCNHPFQGAKDWDSYIRTPENLALELKQNYDMFGTTRYTIMDDTFNDSMEKLDRLHRAIDLAKLPKFEFMSYIKPELLATKPDMIPKLKELGCASGYVGIESLNNPTRKAIKKGMDIQRVLDAVYKLTEAGAKMHGSFIVGLPHDNRENQTKTLDFLIENRGRLLNSWEFQPLSMFSDYTGQGLSDIDRNPESYGYSIGPRRPNDWVYWRNEWFDTNSAIEWAGDLNAQSQPYQKVGGWTMPSAWQLGLSQDEIDNQTLVELDLVYRAKLDGWARAQEQVKQLTNHRAQ